MRKTTSKSRSQLTGLAKEVQRMISGPVANAVREAGLEIVNQLADAGPAWSGKFSASWDIIAPGGTARKRESIGSVYKYTRRNFPLKRFENALNSRNTANTIKFSIVNSASYAAFALDQDKAVFIRPDNNPVKINAVELGNGRDQPSLRHEIGGPFSGSLEEAPAARTAEPDWFEIYVAFALQRALGVGVSRGFSFPQVALKGNLAPFA